MEQGLVHIYCGDGKGKTTCAFGLALRCAGTGARVRIAQFLKGGDSGEVTAMQQFDNVELLRAKQGTKFTFQMNAAEKAQAARDHTQLLRQAFADTRHLRMLVLDEIMAACTTGMVDTDELVSLIQARPPELDDALDHQANFLRKHAVAQFFCDNRKAALFDVRRFDNFKIHLSPYLSTPRLYRLILHIIVTRRPVLQKVRHHKFNFAVSACKHRVSGSLSLPSRGAFHLSLTVLYSIGHMVVFSLRRWSSFLPSGFLVSRRTPVAARYSLFSFTGLLPSSAALSKAFS